MPMLVLYTFCSNWSDAPPPKTGITAHTRQRVPVVLARVSSAQNQGRASVSAARRRHARHRRPPQAARAARLNLGAPYSRASPYRHRNRRDENISIRSRRNVSVRSAAALRASTIIDIRMFSPNQCTCCRNERELVPAIRWKPNTARSWRRSDASLRNSFSASSSSAESAAGLRPTIR